MTRLIRPTFVKVLGWRWQIRWLTLNSPEIDLAYSGLTDPESRLISVRRSPYEREILLHEILHALWAETQLPDGKVSEETVIRTISPPLLRVMIDNPKVLRYLLEAV